MERSRALPRGLHACALSYRHVHQVTQAPATQAPQNSHPPPSRRAPGISLPVYCHRPVIVAAAQLRPREQPVYDHREQRERDRPPCDMYYLLYLILGKLKHLSLLARPRTLPASLILRCPAAQSPNHSCIRGKASSSVPVLRERQHDKQTYTQTLHDGPSDVGPVVSPVLSSFHFPLPPCGLPQQYVPQLLPLLLLLLPFHLLVLPCCLRPAAEGLRCTACHAAFSVAPERN